MFALCVVALICSAVPALLFLRNLRLYRRPASTTSRFSVSVLIPARDEERSIRAAVESVLASTGLDLELIVLNDGSTDATAAIVNELARRDSRVRLAVGPDLPNRWCGKQFACHTLAALATKPIFCFLDADVRVAAEGIARAAAFLMNGNASLVSGFPHQETETLVERMLIPLMHFLLLGFLPIARMRASRGYEYAAGCGQFMMARRDDYFRAGGHAAIRNSRHDGIMLPKAFRQHGLATDLCDLSDAVTCRMYRSAGEVFRGLLKNATEGIAAPGRIVPITIIIGMGQLAPFALLPFANTRPQWMALAVAAAGAYLPRLISAIRFRQSIGGALLHPIAMVLLLVIQWWALARLLMGKQESWKGRSYSARLNSQ